MGDEHAVQPRLVTITQSSEYGTRYSTEETRALADTAHELGLALHMDGSRLSNAAAGLGCGLGDLAGEAGVDVLSLGGTKNGMVLGEAVVFLDPALADGAKYLRKQTLQLASKGRFLAAQFVAMFEGDLWRRNAAHANAMAARLAGRLQEVPGVSHHPARRGQRRVRRHAAGGGRRGAGRGGRSTRGTSPSARNGSCARGTRRPRRSTRSPTSWPRPAEPLREARRPGARAPGPDRTRAGPWPGGRR